MRRSYSVELNGRTLNIETGHIAKQANGSVVVSFGETVVLVTVVASDEIREGLDFLPLTVEYQEMSYAGGKIPGNFFRRDIGRPADREIIAARLIDRPLRPLFPDSYRNETQIIATVLSTDKEHEADVLALVGASAALEISDIPFSGPVAGVRIGRVDGRFIVNPTISQQEQSDINIVVAGNRDGIVMVEGGAKFMPESDLIDAIFYGYKMLQPILDLQEEMKKDIGKEKFPIPEKEIDEELIAKVKELAEPRIKEILTTASKKPRNLKRKALRDEVLEKLSSEYEGRESEIKEIIQQLEKEMMRRMILDEGRRIDGRSFTDIRPIECQVGVLPRVHGSALFTRGETQALVLTTLGTEWDEQRMESIYGDYFMSFMFHYNFPPYSVGEVRRLTGPSRREIGHGELARRALEPVVPDKDQFQYCIRVVSEILESNGSSSMASVCGGSLSLMDAGVPIKEHVAGVAMGLISEGEKTVILTDIIGDEDRFGDMDFKVAGTEEGVTAIQMDIKIKDISREVLQKALEQAKEARLFILEKMKKAIAKPRPQVSEYAPVISTVKIAPYQVKTLIGPGGRTVREISHETGSRIYAEDDGTVHISSPDRQSAEATIKKIKDMFKEVEVGQIYTGKVTRILDFGAIVELFPGTEGMIHISQLDHKRVNKVSDILKEGDEVEVKVIGFDEYGRIRLSRKAVLEEKMNHVSQ